ncbi:MAG: fibronectin type III domain-containing protein [Candidatus Thermoplasmatota archaeon]|nr:fibronectin type III domain-containing protein [Candidatus Thermoplasmatota archaeon]
MRGSSIAFITLFMLMLSAAVQIGMAEDDAHAGPTSTPSCDLDHVKAAPTRDVHEAIIGSRLIGGSGKEFISSCCDDGGDLIVAGWTTSDDLDAEGAPLHGSYAGDKDIFIARMGMNLSISSLALIGGSMAEEPTGIGVLPDGSVYVAGWTASSDLPAGERSLFNASAGGEDGLLMVLSSDLSRIVFSTYFGGSQNDRINAADAGPDGTIYITGITFSGDLPTTEGSYRNASEATVPYGPDAFVARIDTDGRDIVYSTFLGGIRADSGTAIAIDGSGAAYVSGETSSKDFPITPGVYSNENIYYNYPDIFIAHLSSNGGTLISSTVIGGLYTDQALSVRIGSDGLFVTGRSMSYDFPLTNDAFDSSNPVGNRRSYDGLLLKMPLDLTELDFSSYLGSTENDWISGLDLDEVGNIYITGLVSNARQFVTSHASSPLYNGGDDAFLAITDLSNNLQYFTFIGGGGSDQGTRVLHTSPGRCTIVGQTCSVNFPIRHDTGQDLRGISDAFIMVHATPTPPSAPKIVTSRAGDSRIEIEWAAPKDDGLCSISGYNLQRICVDGNITISLPIQFSYIDTEVKNGIEHEYRVSAVNRLGEGERSEPVIVRPGTIPSEPTNFSIMTGKGFASLEWDPPSHDGWVGIEGYIIQKKDSGSDPIEVLTSNGSYEDSDVKAGSYYSYNVRAYNAMGIGPKSPTIAVRIPTLPDRVRDLKAIPQPGAVLLSWVPPTDDGGAPIEEYVIHRRTAGSGNETSIRWPGLEFLDEGLTPGVEMEYRVAASNLFGEGEPTYWTRVEPYGPPGPPTLLKADAGDGVIVIEWDPPSCDGGRSLSGFRIYKSVDGSDFELAADLSLCSIFFDRDVVNGVLYSYRITARSRAGESEPSSVMNARPVGPPSTPLGLTASKFDGYVELRWSAPMRDGGSELLGYRLLRSAHGNPLRHYRDLPPSTRFSDSDVMNGIEYSYALTAFNEVYEGDMSGKVRAMPIGLPEAPFDVRIDELDQTLVLRWSVPKDDGGSAITTFIILRGGGPDDLSFLARIPAVTYYSDHNLDNGKRYFYRISSETRYVSGEPSDIVSGSPCGLPFPPSGLRGKVERGRVELSWDLPYSDGGRSIVGYNIYRIDQEGVETVLARNSSMRSFADHPSQGRYRYAVSATTEAGEGARTVSRPVTLDIRRQMIAGTAIISLVLIAICVFVGIRIYSFRRARASADRAWKTFEMDTLKLGRARSLPPPNRGRRLLPPGEGRT